MNDIHDPVYVWLLKAALECFLADEHHKTTTPAIAVYTNFIAWFQRLRALLDYSAMPGKWLT